MLHFLPTANRGFHKKHAAIRNHDWFYINTVVMTIIQTPTSFTLASSVSARINQR